VLVDPRLADLNLDLADAADALAQVEEFYALPSRQRAARRHDDGLVHAKVRSPALAGIDRSEKRPCNSLFSLADFGRFLRGRTMVRPSLF